MDPLIVDIYEDDLNGKPDIAKLVAAGPPWHGLALKASEGLYYPSNSPHGHRSPEWFNLNWKATRDLAIDHVAPSSSRYGFDWFRIAYHYLIINHDPVAQANRFLHVVDQAGGWDVGDFLPMVDVEAVGNPAKATAAQVIDAVSRFAERITTVHGRAPMLYGSSYMADRGITSTMGCQALLLPAWTETLPPWRFQRIGWELVKQPSSRPTVWGWQYCGDGVAQLKGYPRKCPMGVTDISAVIIAGGGQAAIEWTRSRCWRPPAGCR